MSRPIITQEYLKELLDYSPETGEFKWRIGPRKDLVAGYIDFYRYRDIMIDKKNYKAHRLAWLYVYGEFPPDQLDHVNHIRNDNRISNLRPVTNQENQMNRSYAGNNSGRIGVCFDKARNKWKSYIKINQKLINLGRFDTLEEAILVREEAEREYGFHANHGIIIP